MIKKHNHILRQHKDSVAYVFRKYNIKARPNARNLALAEISHSNTNFWQDLQNAIAKRSLGHVNFEDNYDYYYTDINDESFDGGETMAVIDVDNYDDDFDNMSGKRSARKAKRQQKKLKRKAKKAERKNGRSSGEESGEIQDAQEVVSDDDMSARGSGSEKAEKAMGFISSLASTGAGIASAFKKNNNNGSSDDYTEEVDSKSSSPNNGTKKDTTIYIAVGVGAILLIVGLVYYLKKKSN